MSEQPRNCIFDPSKAGWSISLVEEAANFIAICKDGEIAYINKSGAVLLDSRNTQEVIGTNLIEFVHPDYKDFLSYGLDVLAEENDFIPLKFETLQKNALDVKLLVKELKLDGEAYFVVEAIDITEYKRASEAVREREHRLKSILNTVAEGIITFNVDGFIESLNPAAEKTFGYSSQELLGQHVSKLFDERRKDGYTQFLDKKIIKTSTSMLGNVWEIVGKHKETGNFPLELTLTKIQVGSETLFTAVFRNITERKENENRIKHMAHHDTLTGLPNRQLFKDRLSHAIMLSNRYSKKLVIMFIDLDKFKPINDELGHEAGDIVLKEVAKRLSSLIRKSDTVARIGGDEFVILLEELDHIETGATVAEKILERIKVPFQVGGRECDLGASIGMSAYPKDSENMDILMKQADEAMYAVKKSGRNNYMFYNSEMNVLKQD